MASKKKQRARKVWEDKKRIQEALEPRLVFKMQPGPQSMIDACEADVAFYGGAAFSGKSYYLLFEAAKHVDLPGYRAVIFRRTTPQITAGGGLWDTAGQMYPHLFGKPNHSELLYKWPIGSQIKFSHLENEVNIYDHQGAAYSVIGFDELTHFCLTPGHEVLTNSGWKKLGDVKNGEVVASLNQETEEIEYKAVIGVYNFQHDGDIYCCNSEHAVSFEGTGNHEVLIRRQDLKESVGKKRLDSWGNDRILRTGSRSWGYEIKVFDIPVPEGRGHGKNRNSCVEVDGDAYLQFLGFYIAEGCSFRMKGRSRSPVVSIRQTVERGKVFIRDVLGRLPWRYTETKDGQFKIFSRQLYNCISWMGNTYTKRVPRWVFGLSRRQMDLFVDAFVRGDGHITPTKGITLGLANEGLIDDFQELFFLLGKVAVKGYQRLPKGYDVWRLSVSNPGRKDTQIKNERIFKKEYHGPVHCIEVQDNHNFLCRKDGRYFWSGNSRKQFFYLLSRNRNPDKFPPADIEFLPYVRCTMNPDADSWIREFIDWWIDPVSGYVISERSGVIKWFTVEEEVVTWVDEDWRNERGEGPKSFTFICGNIDDNPIGCRNDPSYRNNLLAQDMVTRERLLRGNWNITSRGGMFNPAWFRVVDEAPQGMRLMRYWDRAATVAKKEGDDPDWTAGALCGFQGGDFYILDVKRFRGTPAENYRISRQTAEDDGYGVEIGIEQEPGSAGVEAVDHYMTDIFKGFVVHKDKARLHKEERAKPWAKLAEQGHVFLVKGEWNRKFCAEAGSFPFQKKDQIDAVSGAYLLLSRMVKVFERELPAPVAMDIAWEKTLNYASLHYGAVVQKKDLSVWVVLALWDNVKCCLYVYDSWSLGRLIPSQLALMLKAKMRLDKYECEKILCNDMMDNDAAHVRSPRVLCNKELRELKCNASVKEAIHFDAYGAIVAGNQLLGDGRIFFDLKCKDVLRQMGQWKLENNKISEMDCGYAEALCLIISELKKKQILERFVPKRGDYVKPAEHLKALSEDTTSRTEAVSEKN